MGIRLWPEAATNERRERCTNEDCCLSYATMSSKEVRDNPAETLDAITIGYMIDGEGK